jgi:hypothetical protein
VRRAVPAAGLLLVAACAPAPRPVFQPMSYRAELPVVTVYPRLALPGSEVVIVARPPEGVRVPACLRVVDRDGAAWKETCGDGLSRRITFRPMRTGTHTAYLVLEAEDGVLTHAAWKETFCVVGEESDCP